jgi:GNAT superfamily N-acetyltransferase
MSLVIRRAIPGDESVILGFIRDLAEYERLSHEVLASEEDIAETFFVADPKVFAEIAEEAGRPLGFAVWYYSYSTFHGRHGLYLEDLFVVPEARGKGIGKALLRHLANLCIQQGLTRFQWWVLDWNTPAIDFYRSIGAEPMDQWTVQRVSGPALHRLAGS